MSNIELELLQKELELLRFEQKDKELNPHKYFDLYDWQDEFIYQKEHLKRYGRYPHRMYLTCANQVGKSFALQLLAHYVCTDVEFRKRQWGDNQPRVFWYILPTQDHINDFFEEKWEPEVLSRGEAKAKGPYSWKLIKKGRDVKGIHFLASNVKLMMVTMASRGSSMQGRSVAGMFFDEEVDVSKLGELEARCASFNDPETGLSTAILAFAFTPTSAQDYFKKIFCYQDHRFLSHIPEDVKDKYFLDKQRDEHRTCTPQQEKEELFPNSETVWKRRVSMFEATKFKSGKQGRYTDGRVREFIANQPTKKDVLVRVFAQFEKEDNGGNIYKYFERDKHTKWMKTYPVAMNKTEGIWTAGLDYGSGSSHPGGVVITHISPCFKKVRVVKMWRGEKGKVTTAEDIVKKYLEMSSGMRIDFPFYDFSCADLNTIHWRMTGKELLKAEKNHEIGVGLVDALLKNNILQFWGYADEPYLDWVATEYENIDHATPKNKRTDELSDCTRYSLAGVAHLFDLKDLVPVNPRDLVKAVVEKAKTPEDYGVRTWERVPAKSKSDGWDEDNITEWEDIFHG